MKSFFKKIIWILVVIVCVIAAGILYNSIKNNHTAEPQETETPGSAETTVSETTEEHIEPTTQATVSDAQLNQDLLEQTDNLNRMYRRWKKYTSTTPKTEAEDKLLPVDKSLIYIASDIHYYPSDMTDYGRAFKEAMNIDDGKDTKDVDIILDTWIDSIIAERPATVILSGDLTLNGETRAHQALSDKLKALTEEGIQVLIEPGNHDINNPNAATYYGDVRGETDTLSGAPDFLYYYHEYGYDQAYSKDEDSLSYLYKIDEKHWVMMIDSAVYKPYNKVNGTIRNGTLTWMKDMCDEADSAGAQIIPVSHQNLLNESRLYTTECQITNYKDALAITEEYHIPVWLSGHLHLQRVKNYMPEPGADSSEEHVTEIVTAAFSMYPFRYGVIRLNDKGDIEYTGENVKVSEDIADNGMEVFRDIINRQTAEQIKKIPDDIKVAMEETYSSLLSAYVSGDIVDEDDFIREPGYRYMEKYMPDSKAYSQIEDMLKDTKHDNTYYKYQKND